jgi:hypothetical protein
VPEGPLEKERVASASALAPTSLYPFTTSADLTDLKPNVINPACSSITLTPLQAPEAVSTLCHPEPGSITADPPSTPAVPRPTATTGSNSMCNAPLPSSPALPAAAPRPGAISLGPGTHCFKEAPAAAIAVKAAKLNDAPESTLQPGSTALRPGQYSGKLISCPCKKICAELHPEGCSRRAKQAYAYYL